MYYTYWKSINIYVPLFSFCKLSKIILTNPVDYYHINYYRIFEISKSEFNQKIICKLSSKNVCLTEISQTKTSEISTRSEPYCSAYYCQGNNIFILTDVHIDWHDHWPLCILNYLVFRTFSLRVFKKTHCFCCPKRYRCQICIFGQYKLTMYWNNLRFT